PLSSPPAPPPPPHPAPTRSPYTTLFRSRDRRRVHRRLPPLLPRRMASARPHRRPAVGHRPRPARPAEARHPGAAARHMIGIVARSEEHTSELQSRSDLVCRLLLEKKKQD